MHAQKDLTFVATLTIRKLWLLSLRINYICLVIRFRFLWSYWRITLIILITLQISLHAILLSTKNIVLFLSFSTFMNIIYNSCSFLFQVKKTFMEPNWWSHHDKWGNKRYSWLPTRDEIPKNLGERPTIAHLQDLEVSVEMF